MTMDISKRESSRAFAQQTMDDCGVRREFVHSAGIGFMSSHIDRMARDHQTTCRDKGCVVCMHIDEMIGTLHALADRACVPWFGSRYGE